MKKIIFAAILICGFLFARAQEMEQGMQQLYYERYQSAENTFHHVLQTNPSHAGAWYGLVQAYLMQNDLPAAIDSFRLAPPDAKSDPYYKIAAGALLLEQNKKGEAANYFNQALDATREKNAGVLAAVASAHIHAKSGDAQYAVALLDKAIKRDRHNAALYVMKGDAYRKLQNGSEAYKSYREALEENEKYAAAYHRIGEIFVTQKNPELYVDYFQKSIHADSGYAPSLYQLYVYEFYHHPDQAMTYYKKFVRNSDASVQNLYDLADLFYLNHQYNQAISKINDIIRREDTHVRARVFKLAGYSYAALKDTARALSYMQRYFNQEADSNLISKDYISMGEYLISAGSQDSLAMRYLEKGVLLEKDSASLYDTYKKIAGIYHDKNDYPGEAIWLGKYFQGNNRATNLDLFNWGLALYRSENYPAADSVFGMYVVRYPEQSFGYYWQAKSKALQDKDMKLGLAVPAYQKLIEVLKTDTTDANYKKWMVESYGYLAAYEVNTQMDYAEAVGYFEKLLEVDPQNEDAQKYINLLKKDATAQGK